MAETNEHPLNTELETQRKDEEQSPINDSELDSDLPAWEIKAILIVWTAGVAYFIYSVYITSIENEDVILPYKFTSGWEIFGRKRDGSNFEWDYWSSWVGKAWLWLAGHVILGQLVRLGLYQYRHIFQLVYSMMAMLWFIKWQGLCLMLGHMTVAYLAAWTGSQIVLWVTAMLLLATLNIDSAVDWMKGIHGPEHYNMFLLMMFGTAMLNLRYISFGSEWCHYRKLKAQQQQQHDDNDNSFENNTPKLQKEEIKFDFLSMMHYCFYLPLCYTGPVFTYNQFHTQFWQPQRPWSRQAVLQIVKQILRVLFATFLVELMLHHLYFNALQFSYNEMRKIPLWSLGGIGYLHGQFFMVKYTVLYGLPRIITMTDQLLIPDTPSCIARIGSSLKYWRTFDRGLYQFMTRHIYIPLGGSKHGVLRQFIASGTCFVFIYYWHGAELNLFYWVLGNFLDAILETIACSIDSLPSVQNFQKQHLSRAACRRIKGLLKAPSFLMTCVAVFTFFGSVEVGKIFIERLLFEGFPNSWVASMVLAYCLVQTDYIVSTRERQLARKLKTL